MPQVRGKTLSTCYMLPKALRAERGSRAERAPALALGGRSAVRQRGSGDEGGREGDQRREAPPRRHRVPRVTALARALMCCAVLAAAAGLSYRDAGEPAQCLRVSSASFGRVWPPDRPSVPRSRSRNPNCMPGCQQCRLWRRADTPTEGRRRIRLWFRRRDSANCRVCGTSGRVDLAP